jgi:hypothetical protein
MPVYQATFRHPTVHDQCAARRITADSLVKAALVAAGMAQSVSVAEQWPEPAGLIALSLLPDAATPNPRPAERPAIERARARAAEFARDAAHARQLFDAACVIARVQV